MVVSNFIHEGVAHVRVLERNSYSHVNLMALYEANFRKFTALVFVDGGDEIELRQAGNALVLRLRVLERAPYTTTWQISAAIAGMPAGVPEPRFRVRLYSDAKVLEVLHFQGQGRFWGEYPYPNRWMYARDEKRQVNGFLGELLGYCVVNGYVAV